MITLHTNNRQILPSHQVLLQKVDPFWIIWYPHAFEQWYCWLEANLRRHQNLVVYLHQRTIYAEAQKFLHANGSVLQRQGREGTTMSTKFIMGSRVMIQIVSTTCTTGTAGTMITESANSKTWNRDQNYTWSSQRCSHKSFLQKVSTFLRPTWNLALWP